MAKFFNKLRAISKGMSPLCYAIKTQDDILMDVALNEGADKYQKCSIQLKNGLLNEPALHMCARTDYISGIIKLINKGVDFNYHADFSGTAMHTAMDWPATEKIAQRVIKWLLMHGANPNARDFTGTKTESLLEKAEKDKYTEVIELLKEYGATSPKFLTKDQHQFIGRGTTSEFTVVIDKLLIWLNSPKRKVDYIVLWKTVSEFTGMPDEDSFLIRTKFQVDINSDKFIEQGEFNCLETEDQIKTALEMGGLIGREILGQGGGSAKQINLNKFLEQELSNSDYTLDNVTDIEDKKIILDFKCDESIGELHICKQNGHRKTKKYVIEAKGEVQIYSNLNVSLHIREIYDDDEPFEIPGYIENIMYWNVPPPNRGLPREEFIPTSKPKKICFDRMLPGKYKSITFCSRDVKDDLFEYIKKSTELTYLNLSYSSISDKCGKNIFKFNGLKDINISYNDISDMFLNYLGANNDLDSLNLEKTFVTKDGVDTFLNKNKLSELIISYRDERKYEDNLNKILNLKKDYDFYVNGLKTTEKMYKSICEKHLEKYIKEFGKEKLEKMKESIKKYKILIPETEEKLNKLESKKFKGLKEEEVDYLIEKHPDCKIDAVRYDHLIYM